MPKVRSSVVSKLRLISRLKRETYSTVIDAGEKGRCTTREEVRGKKGQIRMVIIVISTLVGGQLGGPATPHLHSSLSIM